MWDDNLTFLAKKVRDIVLKCEKNFADVNIAIASHSPAGLYDSAIEIDFKNTYYVLNVITTTGETGGDFCESAIVSKITLQISYVSELGYGDVVRHKDEETFECDMVNLFKNLKYKPLEARTI